MCFLQPFSGQILTFSDPKSASKIIDNSSQKCGENERIEL